MRLFASTGDSCAYVSYSISITYHYANQLTPNSNEAMRIHSWLP
jgi:hypothetical protein